MNKAILLQIRNKATKRLILSAHFDKRSDAETASMAFLTANPDRLLIQISSK